MFELQQPKSNANFAAIKAWKAKQSTKETTRSRKPPEAGESHQESPTGSATSRALENTISRPGAVSTFIGSITRRSSRKPSDSRSSQSLLPSLETADIPDLIVRVSEHSSLDRELYLAYESSVSTQGTPVSITQGSTDHLGIRSPHSQLASHPSTESQGVIPDSESPLGSSSHVPSTSARHFEDQHSSGETVSLGSTRKTPVRDSVQHSSGPVIPATLDSGRNWQRSRSAPASTIPNSTASSLSSRTPSSLPRSLSDPGPRSRSPSESQIYSQAEVLGPAEKLWDIPGTSESDVVGATKNLESNRRILRPAFPASQGISASTYRSPRNRQSSAATPEPFAIVEDCSGDHPSQATATDDTVLSERNSNFQSLRRGTSPPTEIQPFLEVRDSQTPPIPPSVSSSHEHLQPASGADDFMADSPMATPELFNDPGIVSDTSVMSTREKLRRRKAQTDAALAQQRAERQRILSASPKSPLAPRPPSHHIPKAQTPARSPSPSVGITHLQKVPELAQHQRHQMNQSELRSPTTIHPAVEHSGGSASPLSSVKKAPSQQVRSPETTCSRTSKSPSMIPDRLPYQVQEEPNRLEAEPLEIDTQQDVPLPVRCTQSIPHTPITPSKLSLHKEVSLSPSEHLLDICNLQEREYVVPLSMPPRIQQQYCTTIRYHARPIKKILEERTCTKETVEQINTLLDEVSKVTNHIDLQGSGPSSQEDVHPKHEAQYAESCSEKFVFLGCLLEQAVSEAHFSLLIVARAGPLQDILETYLKAKEVSYKRPAANGQKESNNGRGHLEVTLIASDDREAAERASNPDLIIAFDETFTRNNSVSLNRRNIARTGRQQLTPIVRLVVYASLEHIDLCLPRTLNPIERLRRLVFPLLQTQKRVGALGLDETRTSYCAQEVINFAQKSLSVDREHPWPLAPVRPIEGIALMESDSGLSDPKSDISDECKPDGPIRYWPNPMPPKLKPENERNGKRAFVSDTTIHRCTISKTDKSPGSRVG